MNPGIDFSEMRFLPRPRNAGRPESLWLCDNLRCGAPIGGGWPLVEASYESPPLPLRLCEQCTHRAKRDPGFFYTISDAT